MNRILFLLVVAFHFAIVPVALAQCQLLVDGDPYTTRSAPNQVRGLVYMYPVSISGSWDVELHSSLLFLPPVGPESLVEHQEISFTWHLGSTATRSVEALESLEPHGNGSYRTLMEASGVCGGNPYQPQGDKYSTYMAISRPTVDSSGLVGVWWLNGEWDPANGYYDGIELEAVKNGAVGTAYWSVPEGGSKIELSCIACSTTEAFSKEASDGCVFDILVRFHVGGFYSEDFLMTVNTPDYLFSTGPPDDDPYLGGYRTELPYVPVDHCGYVMPSIAVNEQLTNRGEDYSGNNWPTGTETPTSGFGPGGFADVLAAWPTLNPNPTNPQNPLGSTKIFHLTQRFRVGSTTTAAGSLVRTHTLQMYRDHGRH